MFLGWTPICSFKNVNATLNETVYQYAQSCQMDSIRRLKINLKTHNETITTIFEKLFNLSIESIPTYNYNQDYVNAPLVWMGKTEFPTFAYFKTNLGYFNATTNLTSFTYSDTSK